MGLFDSMSGLVDNTAGGNGNSFIPYMDKYGGYSGTGQTHFEALMGNLGDSAIGQGFQKIGGILGNEDFNSALGGLNTLFNMYAGWKGLGQMEKNSKRNWLAYKENLAGMRSEMRNKLEDKWTIRDASARANNSNYGDMNSWVSARMPETKIKGMT